MNPILFGTAFGIAIFGAAAISRLDRDAERDLKAKISGVHPKVEVRARVGFQSLFGKFPSVNIKASDFTCDSLPFHTEPGSQYGEFRHVRLALQNFTLHGLTVESLTADIRHTHFDLGYASAHHRFRITRSGSGPLTVVITLDAVKAFAKKKFPQIQRLKIAPAPEGVRIEGSANFGFFQSNFSITGQPGVTAGAQLILLNPVMTLNGKAMDAKSQESFLKPFTPIVDLDRDLGAEGGLHLDTVELRGDKIVGTGTATIPEGSQPTSLGSFPNRGLLEWIGNPITT